MSITQKIYLAGPMYRKTKEECETWRNDLKNVLRKRLKGKHRGLSLQYLDPTRRNYRGEEEHFYKTFIHFDKKDIRDCTIFVAHMPELLIGTTMEVMYAFIQQKYIIIISDNEYIVGHPWIWLHASKIFDALEEAVDHIADIVIRNEVNWNDLY